MGPERVYEPETKHKKQSKRAQIGLSRKQKDSALLTKAKLIVYKSGPDFFNLTPAPEIGLKIAKRV